MKTPNAQPLSCRDARAGIQLLLDGELASEQHEQLVAHLHACAHCNAVHRELTMIEAAHAELDERTLAPPADYFESAPQRVLARLEKEEQPARAKIFACEPRALKLWELLWGRGRYAMAFAAMLALVFLVTQQLREEGAPQKALRETAQPSTRSEGEFVVLSEPASKTEMPSRGIDSPSLAAPRSFAQKLQPEAGHEPPAVKAQELSSEAEQAVPAYFAEVENQPEPEKQAAKTFSDTLPATSGGAGQAALRFAANPQAEPVEIKIESIPREGLRQTEAAPSAAMPSQARARMQAREPAQPGFVTARAPERENRNDFLHALEAAARAKNEAERLKIWQSFLRYNEGDSASYNARVENVARALATRVDSSASVSSLQEALFFYHTMAPSLVARWGKEQYEREKSRWEGLLNWKKSAER